MNVLYNMFAFFSDGLVERLGWVLLHSIWEFAIIALIAGVILRSSSRSSSNLRYSFLTCMMMAIVVSPLLTWSLQRYYSPTWLANSIPLDAHELSLGTPTFAPYANATKALDVSTLETASSQAELTEVASAEELPNPAVAKRTAKITKSKSRFAEDVTRWLRPVLAPVVVLWSIGVILFAIRPLIGWRTLWRLSHLGVSTPSNDVLDALKRVSKQLELRRVVTVLVSTLTDVPVLVGYVRPMILLPIGLVANMPLVQLEAILAHELVHARRHDFIINLVQTLIETIFFYHPAVWWLSRRLRIEREYCCDDLVVKRFCDRVDYGRALVAVEELRGVRSVLAIGATDGSLVSRIRRLASVSSRTANNPAKGLMFCNAVLIAFAMLAVVGSTTYIAAHSLVSAQEIVIAEASRDVIEGDHGAPNTASHFSGKVTTNRGVPLAGARIYVVPLSDKLNGEMTFDDGKEPVSLRAESDAEGRFAFEAPEMTVTDLDGLPTLKRCLVIATAKGYGPDWNEVAGQPRQSMTLNPRSAIGLEMKLSADDCPIRGRLIDPDGKPLIGARVQVSGILIPTKRDLNAHLLRESKAFYFMNGPSYERSLYSPSMIPEFVTEASTDGDGRFAIMGIGRDQQAYLKITAPHVIDTYVNVMTRDAPDVGIEPDDSGKTRKKIYGANFTLSLERGRTVSGKVVDAETGMHVPGMWVWISGHREVTDAEGRFTITGLYLDGDLRIVAASPPGMSYLTTTVNSKVDPTNEENSNRNLLIKCPRGIPFRLNVINEESQLVDAVVTYVDIQPNPNISEVRRDLVRGPVSRARRNDDGSYEGHVHAGPGAILVETRGRLYRPAHVDPKNFFQPGRTEWTAQEKFSAYGSHDTLSTYNAWMDQHDYSAIVLINPEAGTGPLELNAKVFKDVPRQVTIVDPEGAPVLSVQTEGLTYSQGDAEPFLRSASFPLTGLNSDRTTEIIFFEHQRKLIGELLVKGDTDAPITVQLKPWATISGRVVDDRGEPISKASLLLDGKSPKGCETDDQGLFRMERMIPDQSYDATIYRHFYFQGIAFDKLVLKPGELRELGDIVAKPIVAQP